MPTKKEICDEVERRVQDDCSLIGNPVTKETLNECRLLFNVQENLYIWKLCTTKKSSTSTAEP